MLISVTAAVVVVELAVAWRTYGTPDITIWKSFAATIAQVGPIRVYSLDEAGLMVYNHPPLVGWWLRVVSTLAGVGLPFGFLIRLPSILAHAATVFLVFDMLRRRGPESVAVNSALAVAVSPVLMIIAGFHGNNDPVMAMLTIASVYLLVDRRWPVAAGCAFALAMSVKLVPVVALPLLLVAAWRLSSVRRFLVGAAPVFVLLWVPVLVGAGQGFLTHVVGYNGSGFPRQWGPYKFAETLDFPGWALNLYSGPGAYLVLALCALVPAYLIRNTPERAPMGLGLCLGMFVLLTPGWAPQYTSWVAAVVFLVEFWSAILFTAVAGLSYAILYTQWSGYRLWNAAEVTTLTRGQLPVLALAWLSLIPSVFLGLVLLSGRERRGQMASPRLGTRQPVPPP